MSTSSLILPLFMFLTPLGVDLYFYLCLANRLLRLLRGFLGLLAPSKDLLLLLALHRPTAQKA